MSCRKRHRGLHHPLPSGTSLLPNPTAGEPETLAHEARPWVFLSGSLPRGHGKRTEQETGDAARGAGPTVGISYSWCEPSLSFPPSPKHTGRGEASLKTLEPSSPFSAPGRSHGRHRGPSRFSRCRRRAGGGFRRERRESIRGIPPLPIALRTPGTRRRTQADF